MSVQDKLVMQARALYDYQASPDNLSELPFKKGDIFDVIHSSGKCWEVEVADGSTGMVPSNFIWRRQQVRSPNSKPAQ